MAWELNLADAVADGSGRVPEIDLIDSSSGAVITKLVVTPVDLTGYPHEPLPEEFGTAGPTKVTVNATTGLSGLRLDNGGNMVANAAVPMPEVGTLVAGFFVPAGWGLVPPEMSGHADAVTTVAGLPISSWLEGFVYTNVIAAQNDPWMGNSPYIGVGAPDAGFLEYALDWQAPTASGQWHLLATTWDVTTGQRALYIDGELVTEKTEVNEFDPTPWPWRMNIALNDSIIYTRRLDAHVPFTLTRFGCADTAYSEAEVATAWDEFVTAMTGTDGPGGGEPGGAGLQWAAPPAEANVTGWLVRMAVDNVIDEVNLPAGIHSFDVWAHYNSSTVHGVAHLHAINAAGRSAPAEVEF